MRAIIRMAAGLAVLLGAQHALALGLGEAVVSSDMSGPLRVTIPVVELAGSGVNPDELRIDVPDYAGHRALGIADPIIPEGMKLAFGVDGDGRARVRLSTRDATREPVLRFALRATWPGGQALREYELIIDPPPVARPRKGTVTTTVSRPSPVRRAGVARLSAPAPAGVPRAGTTWGPVGFGDTLYAIAAAAYPALAGDLSRVMDVIVARNPGAFVDGDRDRVMMGASLALPDEAAMRAGLAPASPATAHAASAAVPAAGYTVRPGDTLYAIARREVGASGAGLARVVKQLFEANPDAFIDGDADRLRVGAVLHMDGIAGAEAPAPGRESAAASGVSTPPAHATVPAAAAEQAATPADDELRARLAATEEQVSTERAQGSDLQARLDALMREVESLRARDAELTARARALNGALNGQLERARQAAPAPAPAGSEAPVQASTPASVAPVAPAVAPVPEAKTAATVPAPAARPRVQAPPPAQGMLEQVMAAVSGPLLWVALGALAVVALIVVALRLGRRRSVAVEEALPPRVRADEEATQRKLAEVRERHDASGSFEAQAIAPARKDDNVHMTGAAHAAKLAKEAAVHLAYGDYAAARTCIEEAIRLDPHRDEHKMVLITVYENTGEHARAREIVDDLLTRREQLPGDLRKQVEQLRQGAAD